jgi:hypothetical protein
LCYFNPRPLVEQLEETMASTERLHTLLQSTLAERDHFAAHLYQSRREYRRASATAGKSGKRIEPSVISAFQIAESLGFVATFANGSTCSKLENEVSQAASSGSRVCLANEGDFG